MSNLISQTWGSIVNHSHRGNAAWFAIKYGHVKCLRYAYEHGCPVDFSHPDIQQCKRKFPKCAKYINQCSDNGVITGGCSASTIDVDLPHKNLGHTLSIIST
jgi:hypothetical protein